jgi:hypothetical protein
METKVSGVKVAAKMDKKYGVVPMTFANWEQANRKAADVNGRAFRFPGNERVIYVEVA